MNKKIKVEKRWLGIAAAVLNHFFAWILPFVGVLIFYRKPLFQSSWSVYAMPFAIAAVLGLRFLWFRLKTAIEDGVGMEKEIAREVKFLLPLILGVVLLQAFRIGVANIHVVVFAALISNMLAIPFRLVAYKYSKRHMRDLAALNANETLAEIAAKIK